MNEHMLFIASPYKPAHRRGLLRVIALLQLLVMLMVAMPVCADDLPVAQAKSAAAAETGTADHSDPCCPDEGAEGSGHCSACSFCSVYAPLVTPSVYPQYVAVPVVTVPSEPTTKLPEVHLGIFVPPQNLA